MEVAAATQKRLPRELQLRVRVCAAPDDALFEQVIELIKRNTNWNWSHVMFELVEQPITAVTAHHRDTEQMVASAFLVAPSRDFATRWVGVMVVAKQFRRRGVATCVLNALLEQRCATQDVQRVELLASENGAKLYKTLAFRDVPELNVCLMQYDLNAHEEFEIARDVLFLTDDAHELRREAAELCSSVAGDRRRALQALFKHGSCFVERHADGTIQGTAWIRRVQSAGVETWWLGPLISRHTTTTKSIARAALAHALQHSATAPARVQTLALNSDALFEQMRFAKLRSVPFMRRETRVPARNSNAQRVGAPNKPSLARYVSLFDFHVG